MPQQLAHVVVYGQTGSGKSSTLKSLGERAFLRGDCKVIDLYDAGALEGAYYSLASKHDFWTNREYSYRRKI